MKYKFIKYLKDDPFYEKHPEFRDNILNEYDQYEDEYGKTILVPHGETPDNNKR